MKQMCWLAFLLLLLGLDIIVGVLACCMPVLRTVSRFNASFLLLYLYASLFRDTMFALCRIFNAYFGLTLNCDSNCSVVRLDACILLVLKECLYGILMYTICTKH